VVRSSSCVVKLIQYLNAWMVCEDELSYGSEGYTAGRYEGVPGGAQILDLTEKQNTFLFQT
jgi:hypothetical protein